MNPRPTQTALQSAVITRAQGCLLGQLAGDALGSLVEFQEAESIRHRYPGGLRELADGGTWGTLAGQPTDDSEMALMLARTLLGKGCYEAEAVRAAYRFWLDSGPFDCGATVAAGLRDRPNAASQANGALMRVSPLGIFGAQHPLERVADWAGQDAALTHPHPVCVQANKLFACALAQAVATGCTAQTLYADLRERAAQMPVEPALQAVLEAAQNAPPADFISHQGWVLIALHNALWQLLHANSLEEGVVDTVMRGGDTDTNAAICGALLGAVYGLEAIPVQWRECVLHCRPEAGRPGVRHPRPECFWPVDALDLAARLVMP